MDVKKYLVKFKKEFEPRMEEFLAKKEKQAKKLAGNYSEAIKEIRRLNKAGGKRIRPAFIYTAFKACVPHKCGVKRKEEEIWDACLAMELIQAFCLIHDDIMDDANLRRGKITCFKKLGLNKAILTGDVALILADELVPEKAKHYFDLMKFEVAGGQWLDVDQSQVSNESEIMKIMELKTAMYTVARPLQIGAQLAGVDEKKLKAFFEYGKNLGMAFQIQDDILGVFGKEEELGKSTSLDISEGKKTLLVVKLLEAQSSPRVEAGFRFKTFLNFFGKGKKLTKDQLELTKELMIKSGSLAYCQKKARELTKKAKQAIINVEIREKEKDFLMEIADYIISRNL